MTHRLVAILCVLLSIPAVVTLTACGCGPTGETSSDVASLTFSTDVTRIEVPATILVRNGTPEIEASIGGCDGTALAGATVEILDDAGEPIDWTELGNCRRRVFLSGASAGENVDIRVVVTLPTAPAGDVSGEVELVTYQDVCANVGSSEIVSFGS